MTMQGSTSPYFCFILRLLFPIILTFSPLVHASSYVFGDISNSAPYSLPAQLFRNLTYDPVATSNISFISHNVSDPDDNLDYHNYVDWSVSVSVAADVPLSESSEEGIDTAMFMQATTLQIGPRRHIDPSWKVCAAVYLGGIGTDSWNTTDGTSCGPTMSSVCLRQMILYMMTDGVDEKGRCKSPGIQRACDNIITDDGIAFGMFLPVLCLCSLRFTTL